MGRAWAYQWPSYVNGLSHAGIRIGHFEDRLLWMFDEQRGKVTTRKAYDFIVSNHKIVLENDIMMKIWYFNIPLKIKCFAWLTCNKKINTWDILSKKGWSGPNR